MAISNLYFAHDENAINDPKLLKLRMRYGLEGYGLYWAFIEMLYRQDGNFDKEDIEAFVFSLSLSVMDGELERTKEIINYMFEIGLVVESGGKIVCQRVIRGLEKRQEKSSKAKESVSRRWGQEYERNTNVENSGYERNTIKGKENKIKVKEKEIKEFLNDSFEIKMSELLMAKILKNNPIHKFAALSVEQLKAKKQEYACVVDLMLRVDRRPPEFIEFLICWCQEDDFWKANILSMSKFREKFDQLFAQGKRDAEERNSKKIPVIV